MVARVGLSKNVPFLGHPLPGDQHPTVLLQKWFSPNCFPKATISWTNRTYFLVLVPHQKLLYQSILFNLEFPEYICFSTYCPTSTVICIWVTVKTVVKNIVTKYVPIFHRHMWGSSCNSAGRPIITILTTLIGVFYSIHSMMADAIITTIATEY